MKIIENWISENKLTINYKKSAFVVISNTSNSNSNFQISINHNLIDRTNTVKYLGVYLNSDLFWKTHIDYLAKRLSKVCGVIYKLRHFVPTGTLKVEYFSMFNSVLQNSLLNWGNACKSHLQKLSILQNKIITACLFCSRRDSTALLYSEFGVIKLKDMINMEIAKFMFKFYNKMLPNLFDSYFTELDSIHSYNTRQKSTNEFFLYRARTKMGKKKLHHICLKVWKNIPKEDRDVSFYRFKKLFKINCLSKYEKM